MTAPDSGGAFRTWDVPRGIEYGAIPCGNDPPNAAAPEAQEDLPKQVDQISTIPGVEPLEAKDVKWQRRSVLIITLVPFVGFLVAIAALWGRGLSIVDAGIALFFYAFTGLGVTVGYHRLFTHRSFEAVRPLKIMLAVAGSMALQGSLIDWVAAHRRHHAFSDKEGDPHSPTWTRVKV